MKSSNTRKKTNSRITADGRSRKHAENKQGTKSSRRDKTQPPSTKVIIRKLPPAITVEELKEAIAPVPEHDFFSFVAADESLGVNASARAYISFKNSEEVFTFCEKFDGYVFVDQKGNECPAVVEYAPFQKIPKKTGIKKDTRCGTIDQDPDYLAFLNSLENPETVVLPQIEALLEEIEQQEKELRANNGLLKVKTPLLEYIEHRKAQKIRSREERKEERRRREFERRKAREMERQRKKDIKEQRKEMKDARKEVREAKKKELAKDDSSVKVLRPERPKDACTDENLEKADDDREKRRHKQEIEEEGRHKTWEQGRCEEQGKEKFEDSRREEDEKRGKLQCKEVDTPELRKAGTVGMSESQKAGDSKHKGDGKHKYDRGDTKERDRYKQDDWYKTEQRYKPEDKYRGDTRYKGDERYGKTDSKHKGEEKYLSEERMRTDGRYKGDDRYKPERKYRMEDRMKGEERYKGEGRYKGEDRYKNDARYKGEDRYRSEDRGKASERYGRGGEKYKAAEKYKTNGAKSKRYSEGRKRDEKVRKVHEDADDSRRGNKDKPSERKQKELHDDGSEMKRKDSCSDGGDLPPADERNQNIPNDSLDQSESSSSVPGSSAAKHDHLTPQGEKEDRIKQGDKTKPRVDEMESQVSFECGRTVTESESKEESSEDTHEREYAKPSDDAEESKEERGILGQKDPRTERRIRNKDRPAMQLYRPGQSRLSNRHRLDDKGTVEDTSSSSPSPVMPGYDDKRGSDSSLREGSDTKGDRGSREVDELAVEKEKQPSIEDQYRHDETVVNLESIEGECGSPSALPAEQNYLDYPDTERNLAAAGEPESECSKTAEGDSETVHVKTVTFRRSTSRD